LTCSQERLSIYFSEIKRGVAPYYLCEPILDTAEGSLHFKILIKILWQTIATKIRIRARMDEVRIRARRIIQATSPMIAKRPVRQAGKEAGANFLSRY
jgi:hypothetical protein